MQVWVWAKISSQPCSKSTHVWHGVASYTEQVGCGFVKLPTKTCSASAWKYYPAVADSKMWTGQFFAPSLSFRTCRRFICEGRYLKIQGHHLHSVQIPLCQKLFIAHCFLKLLLKAFSRWTTGAAENRLNVLVKSEVLSMWDWWTKRFEHRSRLPKTKKNVSSRLRLVNVVLRTFFVCH